MLAIGIDPGTAITGYGLVRRTEPGDLLAVDWGGILTPAAMSVGQARGVVLLALQQAGIPSFDYTPNQVKQAVSGYGAADKGQMQSMVRTLLNLADLPKPDDAADALAVAICHLNTQRTAQMIDQQS